MQIIKDITEGLLFSPICLAGKWYLQIAVLHYFDLMAPDVPLSEQDLWVDIAPELGEGNFLDPGFPKARGEILIGGHWYAPAKKEEPGGRVFFSVGEVRRELLVFGPRYWQAGLAGPKPSKPEAVAKVRLSLENAYGGEQYPENPKGIGHEPVATPWGEVRQYLPQVEDPALGLVGGPSDAPAPSCPGVGALDAPSRTALAGTYDGTWLKRYWPGFPADVQDDFFQLAHESQRLKKGWFQGGERVVLQGLNERFPNIESRLPQKRVRVFATRTPDMEKPEQKEYVESATRLETVWLFPGIMRGVALYRALMETCDDELSDYLTLFPVVEAQDAPHTDIHYWQAEQQKRYSKPVTPDPAPLEKAKAVVEEAKAAIRRIEAEAHFTVDRATGLAPEFEIPSEQLFALQRKQGQESLAMIDDARKRLSAARKEYSHLMKIDPRPLDEARAALLTALASLDTMEADNAKAKELIAHGKKQLAASLDAAAMAPEKLAYEIGKNIPDALDEAVARNRAFLFPPPTWSDAALTLIAANLCQMQGEEAPFLATGLSFGVSGRAGFGLLPEGALCASDEWAMSLEEAGGSHFSVPKGYLVPWFDGTRCVRLTVRNLMQPDALENSVKPEDGLFSPCEEYVFPGSSDGLQLLGGHKPKPLLVVEDPVTAWLYFELVSDLYAVAIVTSPAAKAGDGIGEVIGNAPFALMPFSPEVFLPRKEGESAGAFAARAEEAAGEYSALFPGLAAVSWSVDYAAPNPAAAKRKGLDIRKWLKHEAEQRGLPVPSARDEGGLKAEYDDKGQPVIELVMPKIPALHEEVGGRIKDFADGKAAAALSAAQAELDKANPILEAKGMPKLFLPDVTDASKAFASPPDLAQDLETINKILDTTKSSPHIADYPESIDLIQQAQDSFNKEMPSITDDFAAVKKQYDESIKKLNTPLAELAPEWAKDVPGAAAILNPEAMTPDFVLKKLDEGDTRGLVLKDMDFSGMDFSGRVFSEMFLENVVFTGANLSGTRFESVSMEDVDFTQTDLSHSSWYLCALTTSAFDRTDMRGMRAELVNFFECGFASPLLEEAKFKLTGISGCLFRGHFSGLSLELFTLDGTFTNTVFENCHLYKGTGVGSSIRSLTFQGGSVRETAFLRASGENLRLSGVNAESFRIVQSTLSGLYISETNLARASFRESDLPSAHFSGCRMDAICIEQCEMPCSVFDVCKAPGGVIRHSNLENTSMIGFSIPTGSLRKTRLVKADLTNANLFGADLYKTVLGESVLDGVNFTGTLLQGAEGILRDIGMSGKRDEAQERAAFELAQWHKDTHK